MESNGSNSEYFKQSDIGKSAGNSNHFDGDDPNWAVAATDLSPKSHETGDVQDQMQAAQPSSEYEPHDSGFLPAVPSSIDDAGVTDSQVEALVLKFLLNWGTASGRLIASQVALPFGIMEPFLHRLKAEQLAVFKDGTPVGDYIYQLTDLGAERARRYSRVSTYFGAAPVPLDEYIAGVELQSVRRQKPTLDNVRSAFTDLVLDDGLLGQLGEGMNAGRGFFLYGEPGNGKSSIAERITGAYGESVWIPRAISAAGEVIRLYDPNSHECLPPAGSEVGFEQLEYDKRWVRIRRPTIVVGGELKLENLDVVTNPVTGISEAPLQLKANCGTLVIDDFGRQRFRPADLLNRLIVPLEKKVDFLGLPSGRTFEVPFDCLVAFSTNLDPLSLVDEAFLRRIPYKIDIGDPTESQYRDVFHRMAQQLGIKCDSQHVDYLLEKHYRQAGRKMRFCHPGDLLQQVYNACDFRDQRLEVTPERIDTAVRNYLMLQSKTCRG